MNETKLARAVLPNMIRGLSAYGKETMKGLTLLSSGSAAALLAFIGHLAVSGMKEDAKMFAMPLCLFVAASILALIGMGLSYISQNFSALGYQYLAYDNIEKYNSLRIPAGYCLIFAILVTIISFSVCAYAVWSAYFAFTAF